MATAQKKSTGGKRTASGGSRSASSSRSTSGSRKKAPAKRPIRREVGGVVCLLLALCVAVGYFESEGWLIALLPTACKGLVGWGYYLMAPALAVAAYILLFHRGRPVALRTVCVLLMPVVPVAYAVFLQPTMYNGWRHFYFLYPFLCILPMFFVEYLEKKWQGWGKKGRLWGLRGVLAVGFLSSVLWIGVNHPYDYVYFNELARDWALPRFDRDYWGVSEKDALEWICDTDSREEIRIYLLTDFSLPLLAEEDRSRIVRVSTMEEAEYYVHGYHAGALGGLPAGSEGMKPCYSIDVDGYPIRTVYRREVNMYE